jgi:4-hydroxy-tetrahydrodipicolinate synthase
MNPNRPHGVIAAVPTPVTSTGEPDIPRFLRHARWSLDNGCDGLNVLGTTGEANSLSQSQRLGVMEAAADAMDTQRLMVGTGTPDLPTTIALTRKAYEMKFACALVLPPYYYKGVSDDGLFAWYESLVNETRDAPIPIYFYNFPQMTGLNLSPALINRLVSAHPSRFTGAKDSSGDLVYAAELAKITGFDVFPSNETAISGADSDEFAGCISATVNVSAPLAARLWADRNNNSLQEQLGNARAAMSAVPLIPAVKYLVSCIHGDAEFERLLPPHLSLTAEQKATLKETRQFAGTF